MSRSEQITPDVMDVRTRSFGGCATCRSRHVKCDEGRPSCTTCRNAGLACEGYRKSIFFSFENDTNDSVTRCRRPLLTEGERSRMSQRLTSIVPPNEALHLLYQLDEECEKNSSMNEFRVYHGPFGAFKLAQNPSTALPQQNSQSTAQSISSCESFSGQSEDTNVQQGTSHSHREEPGSSYSPWMQDLMNSSYGLAEQDAGPHSLDFLDVTMNSSSLQLAFDGLAIPGLEIMPTSAEPTQGNNHSRLALWSPNDHSALYMAPHMNLHTAMGNNIPEGAVCLLKHYASNVVSSLTPFRHAKTPWHILFLPLSKSCLAALTLGERTDHATMCTFMGTLAISAYGLGGVAQSQKWLQQADAYKDQAREYVKLMLRSAYDVPKVAKYKSILMALITMTQLCIVSGRRDQTECYLLEAEKFIRLRGLNRRKSRKVRMLHHCYVHIRLLHESTFLGSVDSRQRRHVREAVESSGAVAHSQDFPSFRLKHWKNLDREMLEVRSQEAGENDLFLERPGLWVATMYPEIFGIPEPWVFLLSQVIRLGNEKDAAEGRSGHDTPTVQDFMGRAKVLERCITRLDRLTSRNHTGDVDPYVIENVLYGMQCALEIYFYRRIYDLNSSLLQEKVIKMREWLFRHEHTDPSKVFGYVDFIWPAFIAGCEAESRELQQSYSRWFKMSAQQSGLPCFTKTLDNVEQVWQAKRSSPDGVCATWLEMVRNEALMPR